MKILALQAENIKKLVAVEIRPDGNIVQITGNNGQGKTSVLDSIWWALAGSSNIQAAPIRTGEKQARIRLDLGEIIVTRTFKDGEKGVTTAITVENAQGARFSSPQAMLDDLWDNLSFDPLAFSRMSPDKQFATLRKFVPGVDFDAIDQKNKLDYARRTDVNRRLKELRALESSIVLPDNLPAESINESELVDKLEAAAKQNADLESRKSNRAAVRQRVDELKRKIADLLEQAEVVRKEAAADEARLLAATALPDPVDVSDLRQKIAEAKVTNHLVGLRSQRDNYREQAFELEAQSEKITADMEARDEAKRAAIEKADLPVPGIGFGDGFITLDGIPFNQASDAEQLRTSIALAMAANPKLKVLRVRDGSLLDEDSMKLLADMAEANDYQVWIERVDGSGKVGFVLEDGHVRQAVLA